MLNLKLTSPPYETILVMTGDAAYNALVSQSYVPEFGYNNTFSLLVGLDERTDQSELPMSKKAHLLFDEDAEFKELNRKINTGYTLQIIENNEKQAISYKDLKLDGTPLFIKKKNQAIVFVTLLKKFTFEEGDQLVVFRKE